MTNEDDGGDFDGDGHGQTGGLGMDDNDALTDDDAPSVATKGSLRGSLRGFPKRLLSVNMKAGRFFK